jgi:predicted TPR repeat methyltransferase
LVSSKFLHSIGTSAGERREEIVSIVLEKAKRQQATIVNDIGIGTSLTEEDIKSYVKEVEEKEGEEHKAVEE